MDKDVEFLKTVFANSHFAIYPDPLNLSKGPLLVETVLTIFIRQSLKTESQSNSQRIRKMYYYLLQWRIYDLKKSWLVEVMYFQHQEPNTPGDPFITL